jgi:hypothetical protein
MICHWRAAPVPLHAGKILRAKADTMPATPCTPAGGGNPPDNIHRRVHEALYPCTWGKPAAISASLLPDSLYPCTWGKSDLDRGRRDSLGPAPLHAGEIRLPSARGTRLLTYTPARGGNPRAGSPTMRAASLRPCMRANPLVAVKSLASRPLAVRARGRAGTGCACHRPRPPASGRRPGPAPVGRGRIACGIPRRPHRPPGETKAATGC